MVHARRRFCIVCDPQNFEWISQFEKFISQTHFSKALSSLANHMEYMLKWSYGQVITQTDSLGNLLDDDFSLWLAGAVYGFKRMVILQICLYFGNKHRRTIKLSTPTALLFPIFLFFDGREDQVDLCHEFTTWFAQLTLNTHSRERERDLLFDKSSECSTVDNAVRTVKCSLLLDNAVRIY